MHSTAQSSPSRREFVRRASLAGAGLLATHPAMTANPLGLPLGLQVWTVKEELDKDFEGTLRSIAAIGYRELELFRLPDDPTRFRKQVESAGLHITGCHVELYMLQDAKTIETAKALGLQYLIIVFPTLRNSGGHNLSNTEWADLVKMYDTISLDDYKWNADQFNHWGAVVKRAGIQLGYHNHAVDLKKFGDVFALDYLLKSTDPDLLTFELDCGHVVHAGYDPISYLQKYPTRFSMLHLKDLQRGFALSTSLDTENMGTNTHLGAGVINWPKLFAAAKGTSVKHLFVEHEGPMARSHMEEIRATYNYVHSLS
jgi:sugar phosphate isomerase/epimerase